MARGSNFASNPRLRALWFTRLAASGQFNKKCLESKGACPKDIQKRLHKD